MRKDGRARSDWKRDAWGAQRASHGAESHSTGAPERPRIAGGDWNVVGAQGIVPFSDTLGMVAPQCVGPQCVGWVWGDIKNTLQVEGVSWGVRVDCREVVQNADVRRNGGVVKVVWKALRLEERDALPLGVRHGAGVDHERGAFHVRAFAVVRFVASCKGEDGKGPVVAGVWGLGEWGQESTVWAHVEDEAG